MGLNKINTAERFQTYIEILLEHPYFRLWQEGGGEDLRATPNTIVSHDLASHKFSWKPCSYCHTQPNSGLSIHIGLLSIKANSCQFLLIFNLSNFNPKNSF